MNTQATQLTPQRVLQITDCHLVATGERLLDVDTQMTLETVLEQALAQYPADAIIATGDLAHTPQPEVYRRFYETVRRFSAAPLLCLPGNHDVLQPMREAQLPMQSVHLSNWSVVPLDSHQDDTQPSAVTAEDRQAVYSAIDQAEPNILLATHHPPMKIDCPWLDSDTITDAATLLQDFGTHAATSHRRLQGMIFGHAHQILTDSVANVPVWGAPSTCFQFLPRSPRFDLDDQPPGWRWLALGSDGKIETEVVRARGVRLSPKLPPRQ